MYDEIHKAVKNAFNIDTFFQEEFQGLLGDLGFTRTLNTQ